MTIIRTRHYPVGSGLETKTFRTSVFALAEDKETNLNSQP